MGSKRCRYGCQGGSIFGLHETLINSTKRRYGLQKDIIMGRPNKNVGGGGDGV